MRVLDCNICGVAFQAAANNGKYCSDSCRREGLRIRDANWRAANADKLGARQRKWRAANADKVREQKRRWKERNPEKVRLERMGRYLRFKAADRIVKELLTHKEIENVVSAELGAWIKGSNAAIMASEQPSRVASKVSRWKRWQKPRPAPTAVRRAGARA